MRWKLPLGDGRILALVHDIAARLPAMHLVLAEITGVPPEERAEARRRLGTMLDGIDEASHAAVRTLRENYTTPLDRSDLAILSLRLRGTAHQLSSAAFALSNPDLGDPPAGTVELLSILARANEQTVAATRRLTSPARLWAYASSVQQLDVEALAVYNRAQRALGSLRRVSAYAAASAAVGELRQASSQYLGLGEIATSIAVKES